MVRITFFFISLILFSSCAFIPRQNKKAFFYKSEYSTKNKVWSSKYYVGYRSRATNSVYRVELSAPVFQDIFQNGIHRNISHSNYFSTHYGEYFEPYLDYSTYKSYSLYNFNDVWIKRN